MRIGGRSGAAAIIEKALMIKMNRKSGDDGTFKEEGDTGYELPRIVYKSDVRLEGFDDRQVIRFASAGEADKAVIYVHGSAYVS